MSSGGNLEANNSLPFQVTGGGSANPSKVSIPGYVQPNDPGLTVDIYDRKNPLCSLAQD